MIEMHLIGFHLHEKTQSVGGLVPVSIGSEGLEAELRVGYVAEVVETWDFGRGVG